MSATSLFCHYMIFYKKQEWMEDKKENFDHIQYIYILCIKLIKRWIDFFFIVYKFVISFYLMIYYSSFVQVKHIKKVYWI